MSKKKLTISPAIHNVIDEMADTMDDSSATTQQSDMQYDGTLDVKELRGKMGMPQDVFADLFGVTVEIVQNWEQGDRTPEGAAQLLLEVIDEDPGLVKKILEKRTS